MLLKIGAVLAAIPLALFALVGATGVLVVDVRESGPDGHHFIVPVPLLLAQAAAGLAPHAGREVDLPQLSEYLPMAQAAIEGLSGAPDGELVRVEERDEIVLITKVGSTLQVRVNGRNEEVSVNVPLSMAAESCGAPGTDASRLPTSWGRFATRASRRSRTFGTGATT